MKKTVIWLILGLLVFSGCKGPSDMLRTQAAASADDTLLWTEDDPQLQLQEKLVRWYNLNLRSDNPDRDFRDAYGSILADGEGIMGYIEFPAWNLTLPIYHDGAEAGVVHSSQSPFPIGGAGNHGVLTCWESIRLGAGDCFVIYILDKRLTYQVGTESQDRCTLICGNASYTCGRREETAVQ